jgi:hypothetical protein
MKKTRRSSSTLAGASNQFVEKRQKGDGAVTLGAPSRDEGTPYMSTMRGSAGESIGCRVQYGTLNTWREA